MLAALMKYNETIAVSGSHGKTTTTSLTLTATLKLRVKVDVIVASIKIARPSTSRTGRPKCSTSKQ